MRAWKKTRNHQLNLSNNGFVWYNRSFVVGGGLGGFAEIWKEIVARKRRTDLKRGDMSYYKSAMLFYARAGFISLKHAQA